METVNISAVTMHVTVCEIPHPRERTHLRGTLSAAHLKCGVGGTRQAGKALVADRRLTLGGSQASPGRQGKGCREHIGGFSFHSCGAAQ